jgi:hypothetical protein
VRTAVRSIRLLDDLTSDLTMREPEANERKVRDHVAAERDLTEVLREMTTRVPGVWTYGQLRTGLVTRGVEPEPSERLTFALSCLVAGGEAERLGFDSFRIHPHNRT